MAHIILRKNKEQRARAGHPWIYKGEVNRINGDFEDGDIIDIKDYKEINLRALQLIREGGYLITCCCSHHISRNLFTEVIIDAAVDAKRKLRLVEYRTQSRDHPILPAVPETEYLKCFILQVL